MKKLIKFITALICSSIAVCNQGVSVKDTSIIVENDKLFAGVSYELQQELIDVKQELDVLDKTNIEPVIEPVEVFDGYENIETGERFSREEGILIAAVVWCEARGESDTHQQLVAKVILNRLRSDKFPNTVYDVVYQRNPLQYACVDNGQLDRALSMYNGFVEVSDEDMEILERCLENTAQVLVEDYKTVDFDDSKIVYQAEFKQGSGIAYQLDNTYFCFE